MAEVFIQALLEAVPEGKVAGIYVKGSVLKPWDSPLDYVPELSDVDIHVLFADDAFVGAGLASVERSLAVGARSMRLYAEQVPRPLHLPRVQLQIANTLYRDPDYVPSPPSTVRAAFGKPDSTVQSVLPPHTRARNQLLQHEAYLAGLGSRAVDKYGRYLWDILRTMNWRVSPAGPSVLELLGVPFDDAWSINRTSIVARLRALGEEELAAHYAAFYLHAWEYFLSDCANGDAGRATVLAGFRALTRAIEVAGQARD